MNRFNRRNFLKAGSTLFTLPLLESLTNQAYAATASGSLKRVLFFNLSNAQYDSLLFPTQTNYSVGPDGVRYIPLNSISGDVSRIFTANKYGTLKAKMNIMRGFDIPSGDGEIIPGHDMTFALGACGERSRTPTRDSIDTILSQSSAIYPITPYKRILNALPIKDGPSSKYNYSFQGGQQRSVLGGPSSIFTEFFSTTLPSTGTAPNPTAPADTNISRRLAMNAALSKMTGLVNSTKLSSVDKVKLSQHADFINKIMPSLAAPTAAPAPTVALGSGCVKPTLPGAINEAITSSSGNQARIRACLDQIYMAFNCQLTNIATIHPVVAYDTGNWDMGDTGNDQYHQLAGHHYDIPNYLKYNGWVYDQLLYLLNLMEGTRESNGLTMLDNSLVVVVSNDACSIHNNEDIPVITFGSLGGLIKTGNYINYQRTNAAARVGTLDLVNAPNSKGEYVYRYNYNLGRPLGSFYTTLLNVLNISHSGFGSYTDPNGNYAPFTTAAAKQANLPIIT